MGNSNGHSVAPTLLGDAPEAAVAWPEPALGTDAAALQIQDRERRRIGQLLHDGPCQDLIGATFALKAVAGRVGASAVATELNEALRLLHLAISRTRRLSTGLNPVEFDGPGLRQALQALAESLPPTMMATIDVHENASWAPEISTALFRIAEEAISNAAQHSAATEVSICVRETSKAVELRITDNGRGFELAPDSRPTLGLDLMRLRAEHLRGTFQIGSSAGTTIRCLVPKNS